ncbi:regulation of double-strand break repair via homologous recombination [Branchiostoma belcheri]|nr:regulation of double-strand break repair via homologous recombination [Branchiostoma belcheri]
MEGYRVPRCPPGDYCIPKVKRNGADGPLTPVRPGSREELDILKIVKRSFLNENFTTQYGVQKISLVNNVELEKDFSSKRQEMKEHGRDVTEKYLFSTSGGTGTFTKGKTVVPSQGKSVLGDSTKGVYLKKNADVCLRCQVAFRRTKTKLLIYKAMLGRVLAVAPHSRSDPDPNHDCHVSREPPRLTDKDWDQYGKSQVYLYEYDEEGLPVQRPRQVLPYAAVTLVDTILCDENPSIHRIVEGFPMLEPKEDGISACHRQTEPEESHVDSETAVNIMDRVKDPKLARKRKPVDFMHREYQSSTVVSPKAPTLKKNCNNTRSPPDADDIKIKSAVVMLENLDHLLVSRRISASSDSSLSDQYLTLDVWTGSGDEEDSNKSSDTSLDISVSEVNPTESRSDDEESHHSVATSEDKEQVSQAQTVVAPIDEESHQSADTSIDREQVSPTQTVDTLKDEESHQSADTYEDREQVSNSQTVVALNDEESPQSTDTDEDMEQVSKIQTVIAPEPIQKNVPTMAAEPNISHCGNVTAPSPYTSEDVGCIAEDKGPTELQTEDESEEDDSILDHGLDFIEDLERSPIEETGDVDTVAEEVGTDDNTSRSQVAVKEEEDTWSCRNGPQDIPVDRDDTSEEEMGLTMQYEQDLPVPPSPLSDFDIFSLDAELPVQLVDELNYLEEENYEQPVDCSRPSTGKETCEDPDGDKSKLEGGVMEPQVAMVSSDSRQLSISSKDELSPEADSYVAESPSVSEDSVERQDSEEEDSIESTLAATESQDEDQTSNEDMVCVKKEPVDSFDDSGALQNPNIDHEADCHVASPDQGTAMTTDGIKVEECDEQDTTESNKTISTESIEDRRDEESLDAIEVLSSESIVNPECTDTSSSSRDAVSTDQLAVEQQNVSSESKNVPKTDSAEEISSCIEHKKEEEASIENVASNSAKTDHNLNIVTKVPTTGEKVETEECRTEKERGELADEGKPSLTTRLRQVRCPELALLLDTMQSPDEILSTDQRESPVAQPAEVSSPSKDAKRINVTSPSAKDERKITLIDSCQVPTNKILTKMGLKKLDRNVSKQQWKEKRQSFKAAALLQEQETKAVKQASFKSRQVHSCAVDQQQVDNSVKSCPINIHDGKLANIEEPSTRDEPASDSSHIDSALAQESELQRQWDNWKRQNRKKSKRWKDSKKLERKLKHQGRSAHSFTCKTKTWKNRYPNSRIGGDKLKERQDRQKMSARKGDKLQCPSQKALYGGETSRLAERTEHGQKRKAESNAPSEHLRNVSKRRRHEVKCTDAKREKVAPTTVKICKEPAKTEIRVKKHSSSGLSQNVQKGQKITTNPKGRLMVQRSKSSVVSSSAQPKPHTQARVSIGKGPESQEQSAHVKGNTTQANDEESQKESVQDKAGTPRPSEISNDMVSESQEGTVQATVGDAQHKAQVSSDKMSDSRDEIVQVQAGAAQTIPEVPNDKVEVKDSSIHPISCAQAELSIGKLPEEGTEVKPGSSVILEQLYREMQVKLKDVTTAAERERILLAMKVLQETGGAEIKDVSSASDPKETCEETSGQTKGSVQTESFQRSKEHDTTSELHGKHGCNLETCETEPSEDAVGWSKEDEPSGQTKGSVQTDSAQSSEDHGTTHVEAAHGSPSSKFHGKDDGNPVDMDVSVDDDSVDMDISSESQPEEASAPMMMEVSTKPHLQDNYMLVDMDTSVEESNCHPQDNYMLVDMDTSSTEPSEEPDSPENLPDDQDAPYSPTWNEDSCDFQINETASFLASIPGVIRESGTDGPQWMSLDLSVPTKLLLQGEHTPLAELQGVETQMHQTQDAEMALTETTGEETPLMEAQSEETPSMETPLSQMQSTCTTPLSQLQDVETSLEKGRGAETSLLEIEAPLAEMQNDDYHQEQLKNQVKSSPDASHLFQPIKCKVDDPSELEKAADRKTPPIDETETFMRQPPDFLRESITDPHLSIKALLSPPTDRNESVPRAAMLGRDGQSVTLSLKITSPGSSPPSLAEPLASESQHASATEKKEQGSHPMFHKHKLLRPKVMPSGIIVYANPIPIPLDSQMAEPEDPRTKANSIKTSELEVPSYDQWESYPSPAKRRRHESAPKTLLASTHHSPSNTSLPTYSPVSHDTLGMASPPELVQKVGQQLIKTLQTSLRNHSGALQQQLPPAVASKPNFEDRGPRNVTPISGNICRDPRIRKRRQSEPNPAKGSSSGEDSIVEVRRQILKDLREQVSKLNKRGMILETDSEEREQPDAKTAHHGIQRTVSFSSVSELRGRMADESVDLQSDSKMSIQPKVHGADKAKMSKSPDVSAFGNTCYNTNTTVQVVNTSTKDGGQCTDANIKEGKIVSEKETKGSKSVQKKMKRKTELEKGNISSKKQKYYHPKHCTAEMKTSGDLLCKDLPSKPRHCSSPKPSKSSDKSYSIAKKSAVVKPRERKMKQSNPLHHKHCQSRQHSDAKPTHARKSTDGKKFCPKKKTPGEKQEESGNRKTSVKLQQKVKLGNRVVADEVSLSKVVDKWINQHSAVKSACQAPVVPSSLELPDASDVDVDCQVESSVCDCLSAVKSKLRLMHTAKPQSDTSAVSEQSESGVESSVKPSDGYLESTVPDLPVLNFENDPLLVTKERGGKLLSQEETLAYYQQRLRELAKQRSSLSSISHRSDSSTVKERQDSLTGQLLEAKVCIYSMRCLHVFQRRRNRLCSWRSNRVTPVQKEILRLEKIMSMMKRSSPQAIEMIQRKLDDLYEQRTELVMSWFRERMFRIESMSAEDLQNTLDHLLIIQHKWQLKNINQLMMIHLEKVIKKAKIALKLKEEDTVNLTPDTPCQDETCDPEQGPSAQAETVQAVDGGEMVSSCNLQAQGAKEDKVSPSSAVSHSRKDTGTEDCTMSDAPCREENPAFIEACLSRKEQLVVDGQRSRCRTLELVEDACSAPSVDSLPTTPGTPVQDEVMWDGKFYAVLLPSQPEGKADPAVSGTSIQSENDSSDSTSSKPEDCSADTEPTAPSPDTAAQQEDQLEAAVETNSAASDSNTAVTTETKDSSDSSDDNKTNDTETSQTSFRKRNRGIRRGRWPNRGRMDGQRNYQNNQGYFNNRANMLCRQGTSMCNQQNGETRTWVRDGNTYQQINQPMFNNCATRPSVEENVAGQ